jgi:aminopeptidase-like protein
MVNNELSGPVVLRLLADWLLSRDRHYSYRLVWSVETIGAIAFLSDHLEQIKGRTIGGLVLNCLGGPGDYTVIGTPSGSRFIDRAVQRTMDACSPGYEKVSYLRRDSDERQFSSNRAQLPVLGFCKTKPGEFPEYHTSRDDLEYVSARDLIASYTLLTHLIDRLESASERIFPLSHFVGEPFLSKRSLYPTESTGTINDFEESLQLMLNFLAYSDGDHAVADIAVQCGVSEDVALDMWRHLLTLDLVADAPGLPR